jgi:hypothetical protein
MSNVISIPGRFRGPVNSGQGGYSAGVAASFIDGPANVRLRRPPPLDRQMSVETDPKGVSIVDADVVVLVAKSATVAVIPPTDDKQLAALFARGPQPAPRWHMAPTCFVCGTGETLGMHPTRMEEYPVWGTVWTPRRDGVDGSLASEIVWALLDCPAGWATGDSHRPKRSFFPALADMTAEIVHPVPIGRPVAVLGWMTSDGERRIDCESAVIDESGKVLARASLSQAAVRADWGDGRPDEGPSDSKSRRIVPIEETEVRIVAVDDAASHTGTEKRSNI